tara:strand:+ start:550 stop:4005 length:3456 start_codon:yes stop_codon:yes gene_type:complete
MAERIFKSAGVSTREIDLSAPDQSTPSGVPAGIIGTADEGPAFVPVTVSNFTSFQNVFGSMDGTKFGPIAVNEWLRNAQSATFIRVLGAGDTKKRSSAGVVTNAGFVVGGQQVQTNGQLGNNTYANHAAGAATLGRTYLLGTYMSESAGSTIFSEAGLQTARKQGVAAFHMVAGITGAIVIDDGAGTQKSYHFTSGTQGAAHAAQYNYAAGVIVKSDGITAIEVAKNFAGALVAANGHVGTVSGSNNNAAGGGTVIAHVTQSYFGEVGNTTINFVAPTTQGHSTNGSSGDAVASGIRTTGIVADTQFRSGSGGAVPILRGVLLAPSGVILHLSGARSRNGNTVVASDTAAAGNSPAPVGQKGGVTGSLEIATENFVMLLNGHKGSSEYPNEITASFDLSNEQQYFRNIFNTDPAKIEEAGHLLYTSYDIHPNYAVATGSEMVHHGHSSDPQLTGNSKLEDVAFLLTSSADRNAGSSTVPDYEGFEDRFKHAESPFVVSQKYGSENKNLFKVVALSAGAKPNTRYKISIDNLTRINATTYPSFDLEIRDFFDSDDDKVVLESFRNLNLDPTSNRFIGRVIGDLNVYYDFDKSPLDQKINVKGDHPVLSNYVRIDMSSDLKAGNIPVDALPMGFRGPMCIQTSGSILQIPGADNIFGIDERQKHRNVKQPPIPYRKTIALGTGQSKRVNSRLNWGMQFNRKTSITEPNKQTLFDNSFESFVRYLPNHRTDILNVNVASDTFNNNLFSLENISVRTGSGGTDGSNLKADPEYWLSASYVRNGSITANAALKTRALKPVDFEVPANRRYSGFNFFLQNGFDGLNIFNADKAAMTNNAAKREMGESGQGEKNGSTVAGFRKAIDIMGSKADVDIKLLAIPGMREPTITDYAISAVESRFDALYLMDIEERNNYNVTITGSSDAVNVTNTVNLFKTRGLDSSFAAAYFPDVTKTVSTSTTGKNASSGNNLIKVPPSVVALGAFSYNDAVAHPWFAPAGFTRGALNAVESADVRLSRNDLDSLYDADVNPLTAFPGTGVVIWGQKTLLEGASALDRVNVRRLLIDIRRSVRNIANTLLFEPNRQETLDRFNSLVNPILQRVQEKGGVDRYKVVIDTTTTTQADVENNTIRGKIFLQPTRSVEFVALDFVVTNAGAEGL